MRKLLLLLLPLILALASCEKKEYITPNRTIVVNLPAEEWSSINSGISYTASIDMPELDNYMNERGGVLVYASFGRNTYEHIPQVYDGNSYSFITQPGLITLEVEKYNGTGTVLRPSDMTVKIILIESEF